MSHPFITRFSGSFLEVLWLRHRPRLPRAIRTLPCPDFFLTDIVIDFVEISTLHKVEPESKER